MSQSKETPLMQQYLEIKNRYPDAILFFRLGDFYEMFLEDAIEASRVLEITLTSRNKKADDPIPMCGVPYHSSTEYLKRLVQAGYKVAICEQLEDPKLTKGMVKRDVVKVVTPGTLALDQNLETKDNHYLMTLALDQGNYYLLYTDISTGQSRMTSSPDWGQIFSEVQTLAPKEWVFDSQSHNGLDQRAMETLQQQAGLFASSHQKGNQVSDEHFKLQITGDMSHSSAAQNLADFLADYLMATQKQALHHMQAVETYELSQYLQMNVYTKTQLELTESLRTKRRKGSLLWLLDHTLTAMGGRLLHQWLDKPLLRKSALQERHDKVQLLIDHYFERQALMAELKGIYDLERLVSKVAMQTANGREIDLLRQSLSKLKTINQNLQIINQDAFNLSGLAFQPVDEFDECLALIDEILVDEPPISITEGGLIKSGYHELLDQYREAVDHGEQWLLDLQQREREITGLKTLKVGYNKVFGYYIEISALQASQLKDDRYIRKQTLTNNERFITEELKEMESTLLGAQDKALALEYKLFVELREGLSKYIPSLQALAQQLAELDVLINFANISEAENYVQANISDQAKDFCLVESRHPVLEKLVGRGNYVVNSLDIDPENFVLLLTGPNMSGKSTYMRQIAFAVILNQIGCFVPAKEARLPLVDQIFTRIGSSDDLSSGQSTFMVEMLETNYALQNATPASLLLFDEIGRGTATYDGIALAQAILYHLCEKVGAATLFSTHYHELTSLEGDLKGLRNIHVGAKEEGNKLVFLYKILQGPADKSYGIHAAQLAGLPTSLIERSRVILEDLEKKGQALYHPQEQALSLFDFENYENKPSLTAQDQACLKVGQDLKDIDLNQMTPIQAFQLLMEWQEVLK